MKRNWQRFTSIADEVIEALRDPTRQKVSWLDHEEWHPFEPWITPYITSDGLYSVLSKDASFWRIQNVADAFNGTMAQEEAVDFCICPPWGTFWVEWTNSFDKRSTPFKGGPLTPVGMLVQSFDWRQPHLADLKDQFGIQKRAMWTFIAICYHAPRHPLTHLPTIAAAIRWDLSYDGRALGASAEKGPMIQMALNGPLWEGKWFEGNDGKDDLQMATSLLMWWWYMPLVYALQMSNSLGPRVAVVPLSTRQIENRKGSSKRRIPLTKYHVITIRSGGGTKADEGGPREERGPMSQHLVRGHWRHYGSDKRLFGKYSGWVFCPEHYRGDRKAGRVLKTYSIAPKVAGPDLNENFGPWLPKGDARFAK